MMDWEFYAGWYLLMGLLTIGYMVVDHSYLKSRNGENLWYMKNDSYMNVLSTMFGVFFWPIVLCFIAYYNATAVGGVLEGFEGRWYGRARTKEEKQSRKEDRAWEPLRIRSDPSLTDPDKRIVGRISYIYLPTDTVMALFGTMSDFRVYRHSAPEGSVAFEFRPWDPMWQVPGSLRCDTPDGEVIYPLTAMQSEDIRRWGLKGGIYYAGAVS